MSTQKGYNSHVGGRLQKYFPSSTKKASFPLKITYGRTTKNCILLQFWLFIQDKKYVKSQFMVVRQVFEHTALTKLKKLRKIKLFNNAIFKNFKKTFLIKNNLKIFTNFAPLMMVVAEPTSNMKSFEVPELFSWRAL